MDPHGDFLLSSNAEVSSTSSMDPTRHRVKYTIEELLQWKDCRLRLPLELFHEIVSLGINGKRKTRRGTRGGRRKIAKMHDYSGVHQPGMEMTHEPATNGGMVGSGSIDSYTTTLQPLQPHHQSQQHVLQQQQQQQQQQQSTPTADLMLDYMHQSTTQYQSNTPQ